MARKTFIVFWLLSLIPIVLMGSVFYLYARATSNPAISQATPAPFTALWIVPILAAALLAAIYWFIAAWLFKPLQQLTQNARLLAQKIAQQSPHHTPAAAHTTGDETVLIAQSIDQIADNWQQTQQNLQTQIAVSHDAILALTQFAAHPASSDPTLAAAYNTLIAQALEVAVKHLGFTSASFFVPAAAASEAANSPEPLFSLHSSLSAGSPAPVVSGATPEDLPSTQRDLLRKAFLTHQNQIITQPDPETSGVLTETAIPLVSPSSGEAQPGSAKPATAIFYASYRSLLPATPSTPLPAAAEIPPALKIPLTALNAVTQILAALTAHRPGQTVTAAQKPGSSAEDGGLNAPLVQRRLAEFESLWKISQAVSAETDLLPLYRIIHQQLSAIIGEMSSFAIVLYTQANDQLHIPYMISDGKFVTIPPFPMGQGLSSIVIRSGQPLLLTHSSAEKARQLGAIFVGEPAKSWLGVPLIIGGQTLGVIIVQDTHREGRFNEEDQRLLSLVAAQVAVVLRNARLIEDIRRQASTQRQILQITDKIRRSVDTQAILKTTADELAAALNARQSAIQLYPPSDPNHADSPSTQAAP